MDIAKRDVLRAWVFWAEVLDSPEAPELVAGVNGAMVDLHKIHAHEFPVEEMSQWVREWATQTGLQRFEKECCLKH